MNRITKRWGPTARLRKWTNRFVLTTATAVGLSGLIVIGTAAPALAHHPLVDIQAQCDTTTGKFDLTVKVDSDDPNRGKYWQLNSATAGYGLQTGKANRRLESNGFTGSMNDVSPGTYSVTVSASWFTSLTTDSVNVGPVSGSDSVTTGSNCTKSVTPAAYTVTPPTCTSNGGLSIPAQPAGVIVKVNGNTVNPPWSTNTPGSYNVAYSAASGYTLSNNPSGTANVGQQLGIEQCTKPSVTGSVDCSGFVLNFSNQGGQIPATFTVTKPDGTTETVTVPAGGTASRTYPVREDAASSVSVTAPGMKPFSLSFAADCQANPVTATAKKSDKCGPKNNPTKFDRYWISDLPGYVGVKVNGNMVLSSGWHKTYGARKIVIRFFAIGDSHVFVGKHKYVFHYDARVCRNPDQPPGTGEKLAPAGKVRTDRVPFGRRQHMLR